MSHKIHVTYIFAALLLHTILPVQSAQRLLVKDINGTQHNLLNNKNKASVLFFITHDCPISNAYAPEIKRISAGYAAKKIAFYVVYVDPELSAANARQHAREYGYKAPVLRDTAHRLVRKTQVTITPEAAVLAPDGKVLYRGRIDDSYVGFGKRRPQPTTRDLRLALDAVVNNKPVPNPVTKAIGCFIPETD